MYWLIGSLAIVTMMSILAVSDDVAVPTDLIVLGIKSPFGLFLSLIVLAIILMVVTQFKMPLANGPAVNKNTRNIPSCHTSSVFRILNYLVLMTVVIALIVGSALQAMTAYQQAEATKITDPIRVKALVRIEGISDSVYNSGTDSGYRQIAVLRRITPLVTELTPQDLAESTSNDLEENSLSSDYSNHSEHDSSSGIEYRVLLTSYPRNKSNDNNALSKLNDLRPGDELFMSLALSPLINSEQALNNPSGFDRYRWLRGRHVNGVANILAVGTSTIGTHTLATSTRASPSYLQSFRTYIDQRRWQLRQHFCREWSTQTLAQQQAKAVTLSLLTGDRSLINRDTKDLYQLAGISHLLAISGTHVLFLAIVLAGMVALLCDRWCPTVYCRIPRWQVRWWVMIAAAFIYALFTGFDVPAARTAWMLLAIGMVRLTLLPISTMRVLLALAILMAWHDPYVLWQAGYWLSFIAVALLLKYEDTSHQHSKAALTLPYSDNDRNHTSRRLLNSTLRVGGRVFKLQFWLFLTLLPITLLLFGKASLWGLVVNLFAIGLFGWVIVPLNLLAGLFYLLSPTIADSIWSLVSAIVGSLHEFMDWLTSLPALSKAWLYTPVSPAILIMVLLAILPWLLPRGLISRWLMLPPLTLLVMTVSANQQALVTIPRLYILPTGDQYISAALLRYPMVESDGDSNRNSHDHQAVPTNTDSISWLFLADHRPAATRTMSSTLTTEKLAATLAQQLGSLSIDKLEGITVQTSSIGLTDTLSATDNSAASYTSASELLPMTVIQLHEQFPVSQYWQAGRSDRWSDFQKAYSTAHQLENPATISAQRCEQGKVWHGANGGFSMQAMTGWHQIEDTSVWDCTVAIETDRPIEVVRYNAADPLTPISENSQTQAVEGQLSTSLTPPFQSRLILNTDAHQRLWSMWSLLCSADWSNQRMIIGHTIWVGHSASNVTAELLTSQRVNEVITYDDQSLEAALSLDINTNTTSGGTSP